MFAIVSLWQIIKKPKMPSWIFAIVNLWQTDKWRLFNFAIVKLWQMTKTIKKSWIVAPLKTRLQIVKLVFKVAKLQKLRKIKIAKKSKWQTCKKSKLQNQLRFGYPTRSTAKRVGGYIYIYIYIYMCKVSNDIWCANMIRTM